MEFTPYRDAWIASCQHHQGAAALEADAVRFANKLPQVQVGPFWHRLGPGRQVARHHGAVPLVKQWKITETARKGAPGVLAVGASNTLVRLTKPSAARSQTWQRVQTFTDQMKILQRNEDLRTLQGVARVMEKLNGLNENITMPPHHPAGEYHADWPARCMVLASALARISNLSRALVSRCLMSAISK